MVWMRFVCSLLIAYYSLLKISGHLLHLRHLCALENSLQKRIFL